MMHYETARLAFMDGPFAIYIKDGYSLSEYEEAYERLTKYVAVGIAQLTSTSEPAGSNPPLGTLPLDFDDCGGGTR